jgi:hypothetical protein
MRRVLSSLFLAALTLAGVGCGSDSSKPLDPKAPSDAKQIQPKVAGGGAPGKPAGPQAKPE